MSKEVKAPIVLEDVRIGFKNFTGAEGQYNDLGDRNFAIFLPLELAKDLRQQGWNVRFPAERDDISPEEDTREPFLPVKVQFGNFPPKVVMIGRNPDGSELPPKVLGEDEVSILDWSRTSNADVEVRPYNWTAHGNSGVKAYLKSIYVYVDLDPLEAKYGI